MFIAEPLLPALHEHSCGYWSCCLHQPIRQCARGHDAVVRQVGDAELLGCALQADARCDVDVLPERKLIGAILAQSCV